jgi:hypothetical protein
MATLDKWMRAYQLAVDPEQPKLVPQENYYVPAKVVSEYARGCPMRWHSLIGCRLRLQGRGFGEIVRVDALTLWVLFDRPLEELRSRPPEPEPVQTWQFDSGLVTGVIIPPELDHVLARTAMLVQEVQDLPKAEPELPMMPDPSEARRQAIKEYCKERGIECLMHFTRVENLKHIIKHGLVTRTQVDQWRKEYNNSFPLICDEERWDNTLDSISLSISFPNYKLFYEQRQKHKGTWVVIQLDKSILWELDCAFCHKNAASSEVRCIDIQQRKSVEALRAMFCNTPDNLRGKLNLPDRYTTDPQAEVLVLENIPTRYIEKVYSERNLPAQNWKRKDGGYIYAEVRKDVFTPRHDYPYWQKDINKGLNSAVLNEPAGNAWK